MRREEENNNIIIVKKIIYNSNKKKYNKISSFFLLRCCRLLSSPSLQPTLTANPHQNYHSNTDYPRLSPLPGRHPPVVNYG